MKPLKDDEKEFLWEILLKGFKDKNEGYVRIKHKGKNYKRSRIIYQLYHNIKLYSDEIIHHKDKNKQNDHITNLELKSDYEHRSEHNIDLRKKKHKKGEI